jgi:hypothetical protein
MTKWDKLNKELNDALDTMTSEDWNTWESKFKQKKKIINQMEQTVEGTALYLINKYKPYVYYYSGGHLGNKDSENVIEIKAKKCALIAVDAILEVLYSLKLGNALDQELEYYEQVKNELNKSDELWKTAKKVSEQRPKLK